MRGHTSRVWDVDSNQRGDRLLSASGDRTVKVWDWEKKEDSERLVTTLTGNTGDVYSARWHPMGVSTSRGNLRSIIATGRLTLWHARPQNHVATGGYDKIVRLFDVESGSVLKTFTGHSLSISSVLFNPLGNLIVSGSKDSNVRFWDSVSGLCIRTLNAQLGEVTSVDMNDVYLLTSSRDNAIRLWDVRMVSTLIDSWLGQELIMLFPLDSSFDPYGGSSLTPTRRKTLCAPLSRIRPCWSAGARTGSCTCGTEKATRSCRRLRGTRES